MLLETSVLRKRIKLILQKKSGRFYPERSHLLRNSQLLANLPEEFEEYSLFKDLFLWKVDLRKKDKKGDRQTTWIDHLLIHTSNHRNGQGRVGSKSETRSFGQVLDEGAGARALGPFFCSSPRHSNRELDWEWESQEGSSPHRRRTTTPALIWDIFR